MGYHKLIKVLQVVSIVISFLLVIFASFAQFIDPVAIVFAYLSLPFALLSYRRSNLKKLKIYGAVFIASHIPVALIILNGENNENINSSNFTLFERCSNEMFNRKNDLSQSLTTADHEKFERCLESEN